MNIRKLIIEDVRCFAGRQEFDIRPLTFLVGENSTGKSTILGCFDTLISFCEVKAWFRERGSPRTSILRRIRWVCLKTLSAKLLLKRTALSWAMNSNLKKATKTLNMF